MNARTATSVIGLIAVAVLLGFGAGAAVVAIGKAVLPPLQPSDDDTLREFSSVALAHLAWGATTLVVLVLVPVPGFRWVRQAR